MRQIARCLGGLVGLLALTLAHPAYAQMCPCPTQSGTNYRSIGNAGVLASSGSASVGVGGTTVTFSASLPANVGRGDVLTFTGSPAETLHVLARISGYRATVQSAAASAHSNQSYTIARAYNLLQDWENARDGNLIGENRSEVGVAYADSTPAFTNSLTFDGATLDATHTMTLTVPPDQRHAGNATSGVILDNADNTDAIDIRDDYVTVEWMVVINDNPTRHGVRFSSLGGGGNNQVTIRGCFFENVGESALHIVDSDTRADIYNNMMNDGAYGIRWVTNLSGTSSRLRIWNNSINNPFAGGIIDNGSANPTVTLENNIVMNTVGANYSVTSPGTARNNTDEDGTAPGSGTVSTTANTIWVSPFTGNLHLRTGTNTQVDSGVAVSAFALDIDGQLRPGGSAWDRGADERFAGTINYRSIGTAPDYTAGTISVVNGSDIVDGTGTTWVQSNRGRGDRIDINGTDYVVLAVLSDTHLRLTEPYPGITATYSGPGGEYRISRQFNAATGPADWENCIDGPVDGDSCTWFSPASSSMVSDGRSEVGIVYEDSLFTGPACGGVLLDINDVTTDSQHTITVTADGVNRHDGTSGTNARFRHEPACGSGDVIEVSEGWVTIEWLEIFGDQGGADAIEVHPDVDGKVILRHNLIHDVGGAIQVQGGTVDIDIYNNFIYSLDKDGISFDQALVAARIMNNTIFDVTDLGMSANAGDDPYPEILIRNNIVHTTTSDAYSINGPDARSDFNISGPSDTTAPGGSSITNLCLSGANCLNLVSATDLHLQSTSFAIDKGAASDPDSGDIDFIDDIGAALRSGTWDMGADEYGATTAVALMSFVALPFDSGVALSWETGSELDNLGFHLHRSVAGSGRWTRITPSLIPGLGSSPEGASYSWTDTSLLNGTLYSYRLEDIGTASASTFHGPVFVVPWPEGSGGGGDGDGPPPDPEPPGSSPGEGGDDEAPLEGPVECPEGGACLYGARGDPVLRVVSRSAEEMTVELETPGFRVTPDPVGVLVSVPGFVSPTRIHAVDLPFERAVLDAVVGRRARLLSVEASAETSWTDLTPAALGRPVVDSRPDGTVRPVHPRVPLGSSPEVVPRARLAGPAFLGQSKKLVLELHPLRWDPAQERMVLTRTLRVRIAFAESAPQERGEGSIGRRHPRHPRTTAPVLAFFHTARRGLHAVPYEAVFSGARRPLPLRALRLVQAGRVVPVHVEPPGGVFGPGSVLYFHADHEAASTDFTGELSFALERAPGGTEMAVGSAAPVEGPEVSSSFALARIETNRIYQSGLLEASDPWLWEYAQSGQTKTVSLELEGVDASSPIPGRVRLFLQGASDAATVGEHHIRASWNGVSLGETLFEGKVAHVLEGTIPAASLIEGTNTLSLTNVGAGGVLSRIFLDRVEVECPQTAALRAGRFSGEWTEDGIAEVEIGEAGVSGFVGMPGSAPPGRGSRGLVTTLDSALALAVDVTDPASPVWLAGLQPGPGSVRLQAHSGRRSVVSAPEGLLSPRVSLPRETVLRDTQNQADYIVVAPEAFIDAAQPLLSRRESEGLMTFAASMEDISAEFGGGAPSAEAIREFLAFAYHSWQEPSPRYVLLLGDASFDPRNFTGADQGAPLPALWARTSYLWTASDPAIAAVNGEDLLPDLALGRLPATTLTQVHALVQKILDWEDGGYDLSGDVTLVADNPDLAGDFETDIADISQSFLAARDPEHLFIRLLGHSTRSEILDDLDGGLSLLSYVGHGGSAVWASENVLNSFDPAKLLAQPRQPLMLTMNCLNGYFVQPHLDSLAEAFLKAEGRGTIAAFSPSGLSVDGPAHVFHRALMDEIVNGNHERLGDAILAAQQAYAVSGHMPELLAIYHLLGDPGMRIR